MGSNEKTVKAGTMIGTPVLVSGKEATFLGFDAGDAKVRYPDGRSEWVHPGKVVIK